MNKRGLLVILFLSILDWGYSQSNNEWLINGQMNDSIGDFRKSVECYTKVLNMDQDHIAARYNRSVAYMQLNKPSLALVDLNRVIAANDEFANAYFNRYAIHFEFGNKEFAMGDLNKYIELANEDYTARFMRVDLAIDMEYYDVAISDLIYLNEQENDNELNIILAEIYAKAGKLDSANQMLDELILKPDVHEEQLYLVKAIILNKSTKYSASNEMINLYLLNQPGEKGPLKLKADNLFYLKEYENALNVYTGLIKEDSSDHNLLADIGHCYLQLELYHQAEEILTKSIKKHSISPAYAYLGRGIAYFNLNKHDKACGDWQKSSLLGNKQAKEYLKQYCVKETPE